MAVCSLIVAFQSTICNTSRFAVVGHNVVGSCYGSTGPASIDPNTGRRYGGDFPVVSILDALRAQARVMGLFGKSIGQVVAERTGWTVLAPLGKVDIASTIAGQPQVLKIWFGFERLLPVGRGWIVF